MGNETVRRYRIWTYNFRTGQDWEHYMLAYDAQDALTQFGKPEKDCTISKIEPAPLPESVLVQEVES